MLEGIGFRVLPVRAECLEQAHAQSAERDRYNVILLHRCPSVINDSGNSTIYLAASRFSSSADDGKFTQQNNLISQSEGGTLHARLLKPDPSF